MITPELIMDIAEDQWEWVSFFEGHSYNVDTPGDFLRECIREVDVQQDYALSGDETLSEIATLAVITLTHLVMWLKQLGVKPRWAEYDEYSGNCEVCNKWIANVETEYGPWTCERHRYDTTL